jgi:hypothetical protein
MKQKQFTKEFEEEAVRLLRTSGRTKREIGEDLGVSLSTLTRWLSQGRDGEMDEPDWRSVRGRGRNTARIGQRPGHSPRARFVAAMHGYGRSFGGQHLGDALANAGGTAGDERHQTFQTQIHVRLPRKPNLRG